MVCVQSTPTSVGCSIWIRSCVRWNCSRRATDRLGMSFNPLPVSACLLNSTAGRSGNGQPVACHETFHCQPVRTWCQIIRDWDLIICWFIPAFSAYRTEDTDPQQLHRCQVELEGSFVKNSLEFWAARQANFLHHWQQTSTRRLLVKHSLT